MRTGRHDLKVRHLHCQQRELTPFTQELLFWQKADGDAKKNPAQGALVNFIMQRISNILLLALTATLFSAGRFLAVGDRAADGVMYVVVRVGADRILRKKSEL